MSGRNQPLSAIRIPNPLPEVDLKVTEASGRRYEVKVCKTCDDEWYVFDESSPFLKPCERARRWWPTEEAQALIQAHKNPYRMTAYLFVTYQGNLNVGGWYM